VFAPGLQGVLPQALTAKFLVCRPNICRPNTKTGGRALLRPSEDIVANCQESETRCSLSVREPPTVVRTPYHFRLEFSSHERSFPTLSKHTVRKAFSLRCSYSSSHKTLIISLFGYSVSPRPWARFRFRSHRLLAQAKERGKIAESPSNLFSVC
jgi:hypothetical protein